MLNPNPMTFRNTILACLPILLICLVIVPYVQAQSGITSISNLQYPKSAELQAGVAQVTVTFTVYYNYYYNPQGYLVYGVTLAGASYVKGSGTSTPDVCQSVAGTSLAGLAVCLANPTSRYGTEYASFTLTFNSPQQYALRAVTGVVDQWGNVVTGSSSLSDFTISITGQPSTTTITNLQYPSHVVFQNGAAQATVTLTVGYARLPESYVLAIAILDAGTSSGVKGSGTSTPDPCQSLTGTSVAGYALCVIAPSSSSGTESARFTLTFNSTQQYALRAAAAIDDRSLNPIPGSTSKSDFTISVTDKLQLTVTIPGSVTVTIDGAPQTAGAATVSLLPGTHTISVPQTVPLTTSSRLIFDHWSDGLKLPSRTDRLDNDTALTATYVTQYSLSLTDPSATGAGWYDQGTIAQFSVPSSKPASGILGILGATLTFQGWYENGALVSSGTSGSMTMSATHMLSVRWAEDDTVPIVIIIVIVALAVAVIGYIILRRKRTAVRAQPMVTPARRARKRADFCENCGAKLAPDNEFCTKCGARRS